MAGRHADDRQSGHAYAFRWQPTGWQRSASLIGAAKGGNQEAGSSVPDSGTTTVVGDVSEGAYICQWLGRASRGDALPLGFRRWIPNERARADSCPYEVSASPATSAIGWYRHKGSRRDPRLTIVWVRRCAPGSNKLDCRRNKQADPDGEDTHYAKNDGATRRCHQQGPRGG
jgi:hypothetical protein